MDSTHKTQKEKARKKKMTAQRRAPVVAAAFVVCASLAAYFILPASSLCVYTIRDGDTSSLHTTWERDPEAILAEAGVSLGGEDTFAALKNGFTGEITITRSKDISITCGSEEVTLSTTAATVGAALEEADIALTGSAAVYSDGKKISRSDEVSDGMEIEIRSGTESKTITSEESIPCESVTYMDPTLPEGERKVQTAGTDGVRTVVRQEIYSSGVLQSTKIVSSRVTQAPVDEVIYIGTGTQVVSGEEAVTVSAEEEPASDAEDLETISAEESTQTLLSGEEADASAGASEDTAYASDDSYAAEETYNSSSYDTYEPAATEENTYTDDSSSSENYEAATQEEVPAASAQTSSTVGSNTITTADGTVLTYSSVLSVEATAYTGGGTTASGTAARYGEVAVDPSVIPLGTKLYIVSNDGNWVYGVCYAEDTGGAIKGNIVDLYFDSYNTCIQFGRRGCTVYILD